MEPQLRCKICKTKRELTEEEINKANQVISEMNLKPDTLLKIWSIYDGEKCPNGGEHEYEWNREFFQKMLDDAARIRDNEAEIIRNKNENAELENKIQDFTLQIEQNNQKNQEIEQSNKEIAESVQKISGRDYKQWL